MPTEVLIRPATPEDLPAIAEIYLSSRAAAVPAMPPVPRTPDHVREHFSAFDLGSGERSIWIAEADGPAIGYAETKGAWLDDLYVVPEWCGQGVGTMLLELVKAEFPGGFCLWVFETNEGARRFYRRHGLVELERTDGSSNEEGAPHIRMAWPGRDPVDFLRRLIDEVDDQLGDLLARRAALTREVQRHKHDRSRDAEREREIAARLALRAPELGEERIARIVHAFITESLDVSD